MIFDQLAILSLGGYCSPLDGNGVVASGSSGPAAAAKRKRGDGDGQEQGSTNLKTEGLPSNQRHDRRNLPPRLRALRDAAEELKAKIAPKWKDLDDDEKLAWWEKFMELVKGEIELENDLLRIVLQEMEEYYEKEWNNSKKHQNDRLGLQHKKNSAIIYALDRCFDAYNNNKIIYVFKFTESPKSKDKVKFDDSFLGEYDVGMQDREHIAGILSGNRNPYICRLVEGGRGRRFGIFELPDLGGKFDPKTHVLDYTVGVFGLFDGDTGAYYFEFIMTYVCRFFFSDFTCVNRSYTGIIRESACPDAGTRYKQSRKKHGCAIISFDVKDNPNVGFNSRFAEYDKSKGGKVWFMSQSYKNLEVVECEPTARWKRKMENLGIFEDLEKQYEKSPSMREYRWNETADLLSEYAAEFWASPGEGEEPNYVKKENCTGKYAKGPRGGTSGEPYLMVWFMIQIGIYQMNGEIIIASELRKKRLEAIGASFDKEVIEKINKLKEKRTQDHHNTRATGRKQNNSGLFARFNKTQS